MLSFPTDSVMTAGKASFPFNLPSATAFCTAFSIASWEFTPTVFRNLRMLMLSASSFIVPPSESPVGLEIIDEPVRRRVVSNDRVVVGQLGQYAVGERLAELHAPLVE